MTSEQAYIHTLLFRRELYIEKVIFIAAKVVFITHNFISSNLL